VFGWYDFQATLDFAVVDGWFVLSMFLGKLFVMVCVAAGTLLLDSRLKATSARFIEAGLRSKAYLLRS
jgi:hypothetical protein